MIEQQTVKEDLFNILRLLASEENATQRKLSTHLNFSLGKTNYLLKSLIQKGFIEIGNFTAGDKKMNKVKYVLTRKGFKHKINLAYHYLEIKEKEYLLLKKEVAYAKR